MNTLDAGFRGKIREFLDDETRELSLEGARNSGKTTAALYKVLKSCERWPGIWWFAARFADGDNDTKLKPELERVAAAAIESNTQPLWNSREKCYDFPNASKIFSYGLKAPTLQARYSKVRGLGVSGILIDQAEELDAELGKELRAGLRQPGFPHQLIFSHNPPNEVGWLPDEFPIDNSIDGRRHYTVSLYDNAHNLSEEDIAGLEKAYPPTHAKYRSLVLGLRGVNVTGVPIYGDVFVRRLHVRPLEWDDNLPLVDAIDHGKTHPTWVIAQRGYFGGWQLLGGIVGQGLFLDEFIRIVQETRDRWFPHPMAKIFTACDPSVGAGTATHSRFDAVQMLRDAGFALHTSLDSAKAHDVRLALIERLAAVMQRRNASGGEAFAVESDRSKWLRATRKGVTPWEFIADACEAGYAWDEHVISIANKEVRQPKADDWFEHGMACLENLELHFSVNQATEAERHQRRQRDHDNQPTLLDADMSRTAWMGY